MIASKSAGQADICSAVSTTQRVQITDLELASPGKHLPSVGIAAKGVQTVNR